MRATFTMAARYQVCAVCQSPIRTGGTGLTTEQLQKIYTGEITNWSQVGGEDRDIIPFQRNPEAGSQA